MKLDRVKQEPRQWVQPYFDRLDKLFRKGKIKDDEQRCIFIARLCLGIKKLCMVQTYANVEELLATANEVEKESSYY